MNGSVEARPGYFALTLHSSIHAEMTVTNHTALYQFTFPDMPPSNDSIKSSPLILLDIADLPHSRTNGSAEVDPKSGRITAFGTFSPSFGIGSYKSYACADFSGASLREIGVFVNDRAGSQTQDIKVAQDGVNFSPETLPAGAYARFNHPENKNQLLVRVGVGLKSTEQACSNAEKEIPSFNFDETLSAAESAWRRKLSVIKINAAGVDASFQKIFWSGVYRGMISPQDYTGENPLWESDEPYYDSFYCLWDSFRSIHPMITLLDPESQTRMVRSLIDIYRHEGKLPDCRMSLCKGFTQGGSNADVVLADSYLKNISDGVDWRTAYEAVVSDAELEPANWGVEGRGGLDSWKSLHYIPTDDLDVSGIGPFTRSISRTVEYAYDDFCIAEMAQGLGYQGDCEKYLERSSYWKNMFKSDQTSNLNGTDTGFVGFLQPRYLNGTWGFQDPAFCSPLLNFTNCYLNPSGHETYEGSSWLYTFFAPGDMAALITMLGGPETFVKRLDYLHASGLLYIGDEQAFLTVYQYHYAGRPGKSAERVHQYIPSRFNTTLAGIPGNDDSGAMGSFAALSVMGIFPNPGQNVYFITPPFFPSVSITNPATGKTARIRNLNFDAGYKNIYIQSARLNGKPWTKNWLTHDFFLNGGTLELSLGRKESSWGTLKKDIPPSASSIDKEVM